MEWLIDIIKEWVIAQAYATEAWVYLRMTEMKVWAWNQGWLEHAFVDRGDPAGFDYDWEDFTRDDAWHDLDLSSIVPAGAKAVSLYLEFEDALVLKYIMFRKKGNVNEKAISKEYCSVANIESGNDLTVPLGENRVIQYKTNMQDRQTANVCIKGWWL